MELLCVKLILGFLCFFLLGRAVARVGEVKIPSEFSLPYYLLLGQMVALFYFYARSLLASVWGFLPDQSSYEYYAWVLLSLFLWKEEVKTDFSNLRLKARKYLPSVALLFFLLGVVISQKWNALGLPSSDPDFHALFAKLFLKQGGVAQWLDAELKIENHYPSGFPSLLSVWIHLTGLAPVEMTQLMPFLQWAMLLLFIPALFPSRYYATVHILGAVLLFNFLLHPEHKYLEGTARISHSLFMLAPFFLGELTKVAPHLRQKTLILMFLVFNLFIALLINPAHFFVTLLLTLAFNTKLCVHDSIASIKRYGRGWLVVCGVLAFVFYQDPFYSKFLSQWFGTSSLHAQIPTAQKLPEAGADFRSILMEVFQMFLAISYHGWIALASCLGLLGWAVFKKEAEGSQRAFLKFFWVYAVGVLVSVVLGFSLPRNTLHQKLFYEYWIESFSLFAFYGLALFFFSPLYRLEEKYKVVGVVLVLFLSTSFYQGYVSPYYSYLPKSSLGQVSEAGLAMARWAEQNVPQEERILLPGMKYQTPHESWLLTYGQPRALVHYSFRKTAFFHLKKGGGGMENPLNYESYQAHFLESFDRPWLIKHRVFWIAANEFVEWEFLVQNYEKKWAQGSASLWRLKGLD